MSDTLNNRYVLESELGRGGMGVVYRAKDMQLDRHVAVKVLPAELSRDKQFLERFRREVLNSAKLNHPHIVQVHDVGADDGTNYYVMQLIDGSDLRTEIQKHGQYSVEETAEIISQVASALDYAHEHGIVHRDIKPDNILIDSQGTARVVDFGIAKTMEGTQLTGGVIGTPEYMSPEQARGEALDGRCDQYSLAIVAYEMLTGTTPFRSDSAETWALVNMHAATPPPDPRDFAKDLPDHVAAALLQALEKLPSRRFTTCKQFAEAIRGKVKAARRSTPTDETTVVRPVSKKPYQPVPTRTSPLLPAILGIIVILLLLGGGLALTGVFAPKEKIQVEICKESNLIARADCPRTKTVTFDKGKEPQKECDVEHVQPAVPTKDAAPKDEDQTAPTPAAEGPGRWPWTAERLITPSDIEGLSPADLDIMRNEIYARHGWLFRRKDLRQYFGTQSWYTPRSGSGSLDEINNQIAGEMNSTEKKNADIIKAYQKRIGVTE